MPGLCLLFFFFFWIMTFLHLIVPNNHIYTRTLLFATGRAQSDAELRSNLRLIAAILLAFWSDTKPDLSGSIGEIFDVVTSEPFYMKGLNKTVKNNDERLWFCTYAGFEKLTSQWARDNAKGCHGVVCLRIHNQDARHNDLESHSIQIYY